MGEAARAIGVSVDTLRRWDRQGKLATARDAGNRRTVSKSEVERLTRRPHREPQREPVSARNHLPGVVKSIEVDGIMGLVEIQAGPFVITSVVTRDAINDLGLAVGAPATAVVKSTSVMIERPR